MSDFVRMPLEKIKNRRNIFSRLEKVERKTGARRSFQTSDLSNISDELTGVTFWAIDPNTGNPRMVMSGEELTEYIGVDAHFAGIDESGVVQVYLNADDGTFKFLGGSGTLDENGITIDTSVDQTQAVFQLKRQVPASGIYYYTSMFATGDRGRFIGGYDGSSAAAAVVDYLGSLVRIGASTASSVSDYTLEIDTANKQMRGGGLSSGAISDDGVFSFTPIGTGGILIACAIAGASVENIIAFYSTSGSAVMTAFVLGSQTETTTGALTGTTGTDGKFTVSAHTDGKLYFENRRGGGRTWRIHPLMITG